jgi:DNA-binding response OmpR family regulator
MSRIIVIEDDLAILRGLRDNLEYESYQVYTATDGEQGYRLIQKHHPHLIVLDLMMPRMSGYELCQKVRSEGITTPQ